MLKSKSQTKLTENETQRLIQLVQKTQWDYHLEQYENAALKEINKSVLQVRKEIGQRLKRVSPEAIFTKDRLNALADEMQDMTVAIQGQITGEITQVATSAGAASYTKHNEILSFGNRVPNFNPVTLSAAQLHSIVVKTPIGGKILNQWVRKTFEHNIQETFKSEIMTGILKGEGYKSLVKRFDTKAFSGLKNDVEALTRSYVQSVNVQAAQDVAKANKDIVKGWKWSSVAENRTCVACLSLDSADIIYPLGTGPEMPLHIRCLLSKKVPIYTSKGWKRIGEIIIGDLVLTHKNRFRKVYALPQSSQFQPDTVRIEFQKFEGLSITANHMIQVGKPGTSITYWKEAGDIKIGDYVMLMANRCQRCNKLIPYTQKYCGHRCVSLDITDRQWADPKHKANMSQKTTAQLNKEYSSGIRNRYKITRKANRKNIKMLIDGTHVFQQEKTKEKNRTRNKTIEVREASSKRMKKNNPMNDPSVVRKVQDKLIIWRDKYPEKHPNVIMAKKGFMSGIERRMKQILDNSEVKYEAQFPIKRKGRGCYYVDFAIESLKIAIEVDGAYWHKNLKKDKIRQQEIEKQGWTVIRFSEEKINNCLPEVVNEVGRILCNHTKKYETVPWLVTSVIKKKLRGNRNLYNLSVEEDESYIARGVVVHNCRCFPEIITKTFRELGVDVDEIKEAYRPYTIRGQIDPITGKIIPGKIGTGGAKTIEVGRFLGDYNSFFKAQSKAVQLQMLGPTRYDLWKKGMPLSNLTTKDGRQKLIKELTN